MRKALVVLAILALTLSTSAFGAEALQNGGFDSGELSPWVTVDEGIGAPGLMTSGGLWGPSTAPRNGTGLLGISACPNMGGSNAGAYQTFSTGASEATPVTVAISGYVAGGIGSNGWLMGSGWWEVRLIEGEFTGLDAGTLLWRKELTEQGFDWTLATGTVTTTSPTATLVLKYGGWDMYWMNSNFGAYFDSFSVDVPPVPEPSSMLALGTGLMGLAGFAFRRRK